MKRLGLLLILLAAPVQAQQPERLTLEQRITAKLGQCSLRESALETEVETLRARVAQLEKERADAKKPAD